MDNFIAGAELPEKEPEFNQSGPNDNSENAGPQQCAKGESLISHERVMSSLLEELKPIDFAAMAALEENDRILKKHYVVISIEQILTVAKERRWSLCVSGGSLYTYNGEYWKQIPPEELRHFLGNAAERLGVDKYDARHHQFRNELYKQFMSTAYLPRPNKKTNEVLINLKNGTFVITPDKQYLRAFDRSDFMTYQLPFEYDSSAEGISADWLNSH
jgi:putative DNA primase/helicase